jgi:hypothetical protein
MLTRISFLVGIVHPVAPLRGNLASAERTSPAKREIGSVLDWYPQPSPPPKFSLSAEGKVLAGIYRLAQFPPAERPDLVLWSLWSRNRNQETEGVYSHQTALSLHGLSDLNPSKLHMTVPTHFRRNSEIPGILVLHYADLPGSDVETTQGFKFTRPLRTILDLVETDTVERSFIRQALRQALQRGLITRQQIRNAQLTGLARKLFVEVLRRVA